MIISQSITRKRTDVLSPSVEIGMILWERVRAPNATSTVRSMSEAIVTTTQTAIEMDIQKPDLRLQYLKGNDVMLVTNKVLVAGSASANALVLVTGESEAGFKLDVVGAFKEEQQSAFFWG